ncbi:MAG: hypothetical protein WD077_08595 [Bacteroidia bacterium]
MDEKTVNIKRYELWIGIVTLIGILILSGTSLVKQYLDSKQTPQIVIKDAQDIRNLIKMPLEGKYSIKMDYSSFHSDSREWRGTGMAYIIWNSDNNKYEMLLGGMVFLLSHDNPDHKPHVTYLVKAQIFTDDNGKPSTAKIPFKYITAMGVEGFQSRSDHHFVLGQIDYFNLTEIILYYESNNTKGKLTLIKE